MRASVALCVLVYRCCESRSDSVPQLGNLLSLGDVALDGIGDSRFGSALTGVLAAQKGCIVMRVLLGPSWGACIKLLRDLRVWGPCVLGGGRLCHPDKLLCAAARRARRTLEVLPESAQ